MGWLFSTTRNPEDPHQLRIAVHELGHAVAWQAGGLTVGRIKHTGDEGACRVTYYPEPDQLHAFAIGCWAGFEAEDRWMRAAKRGRAKRTNSAHDLDLYRTAVRELRREYGTRLSESKARSQARTLVARRWALIERTAPVLIRQGRIHL
ncbi:hypothetical protein B1813_06675 [Saccharomonospora piscinae]|uniref:Uncharacterized protein n=1 Tax=Saccharomonospora piscinae TaxID=687388 RepID=A0A1V9A490_SACPI|nr:hypothetical protein [Saccharomonospora piscinae]OQO91962.1 hypothetical protein B1813_06675 [Saccharomonospora piscinae]